MTEQADKPPQPQSQQTFPNLWNFFQNKDETTAESSGDNNTESDSTANNSSDTTIVPFTPPPICFVCSSSHKRYCCPLLNMDEAQQAQFFHSVCVVCKGFHEPNRCPLLKMDETQQARFFQNILKPENELDWLRTPTSNNSNDGAQRESTVAAKSDRPSTDAKAVENGLVNTGTSSTNAKECNSSEKKERKHSTRDAHEGDSGPSGSSAFVDVPLAAKKESAALRPSKEGVAPKKNSFGKESRESTQGSDTSSLKFASSPADSSNEGVTASRKEVTRDSLGSTAKAGSVTSSDDSVEPLHKKYSPADISYSLDVISTLRQSICVDDESTIDIVDETSKPKKPSLPSRPPPVFYLWTYLTEDLLHATILRCIVALSKHASRNPYRYICGIIALSFALAGTGLFTNFSMVFDHEELFTPMNSLPKVHGDWIYDKAGFEDTSDFNMVIHSDGTNIMHVDAMRRTFEALDTLRSTPGYSQLCATSSYLDLKGKPDCWVWSPTQFWKHDVEMFEESITTDEELIETLSLSTYPDGTPVYKEASYGKHESVPAWQINRKGKNITYDLLTYVPNFMLSVGLPDTHESELFQEVALERMKELKARWEMEDRETNPNSVKLEFFTIYAYLLEYERALNMDMPLVPLTFYVMLLFTCVVFHRLGMGSAKSPTGLEPSRFSLGILSTLTIGMSLMSGYGLMFCLGVPFTNLSQMVPFIILGVGLDDTFIITGTYFRKLAEEGNQMESSHGHGDDEEQKENEAITERIAETMEEVGLSIALTTTTTTFAFCLGCFSMIPGIQWVCLYASATIFIDFIFQITLFVAFLTLDERRMLRARKKAKLEGDYLYLGNIYARMPGDEDEKKNQKNKNDGGDEKMFTQRIMRWYAKKLLRPKVKVAVLAIFAAVFALCVWRTTLLEQAFNVEDYVPEDSYTKTFFSSLSNYSSIKLPMTVYFRDVNQSDPIIQEQMREYIGALSELPQIQQPPDFCWVRDLHAYMTGEASEDMNEDEARQAAIIADAVQAGNKTFSQQLDMVLNIPVIRDVYGGDIVRDENGTILTSRCYIFVRHLDMQSVHEQTQLLYDQRQVTALFQPRIDGQVASTNRGELSFFAFDEMFYYWELYTVAVDELIFNTISGVFAVCIVGFILIPHWTATAFIFPIIIMLYFFLLGTLQICGVFINAVTYVTIVIAIGLLVDFLMHILMRYYESTGRTREEKVIETLETMGASMLMGGFTTWLGVIPLSLSSTKIFNTIFIAFMAMVSWGLLVSLVLMPVVLSLCGPIVCTIGPRETRSRHPHSSTNRRTKHSKNKSLGLPSVLNANDLDDDEDDSSLGTNDSPTTGAMVKHRDEISVPSNW